MLRRPGEPLSAPADDRAERGLPIGEAVYPVPFRQGLEYASPVRGTWNIVHTGMLIPGAHEIYVCAAGCLRGVVLTAAEMGAQERFSTVAVREHDLLDGDMPKSDNELGIDRLFAENHDRLQDIVNSILWG